MPRFDTRQLNMPNIVGQEGGGSWWHGYVVLSRCGLTAEASKGTDFSLFVKRKKCHDQIQTKRNRHHPMGVMYLKHAVTGKAIQELSPMGLLPW